MKVPTAPPSFPIKSLQLGLVVLTLWGFTGLTLKPTYQQEEPTPTLFTIPSIISPSPMETQAEITETASPTAAEFPTAIEQTPAGTATQTYEPANPSGDYVPGEVLVRLRRTASREVVDECIRAAGGEVESGIDRLRLLRLRVPEASLGQAISQLTACPGVRYAEPNYTVHIADTIPSDPDWSLQYGLINIRAPQGWDLSTGSAAITIAIVDTGVDLGHPDLAGKLVPGYDFVNADAIPQDDNGHGTHVAGISAAAGNNALGIAGVSWGARIMPVKVLNAGGNGTFAGVADGIIWATDQGAQIINLSLGGSNLSQLLQDAVTYAHTRGVVLVAASGNTGSSFILYPARFPEVIAVGATDPTNAHAGFSNSGPEMDLAAPGVSIYSTTIGGYGYRSGTSMAAPFVSGLAAILYGVPGNGSPDAIAFQMENSALDVGPAGVDSSFGYGLIQMDGAIGMAMAVPSLTPSPAASATSLPPPSATFVVPAASSPLTGRGGQVFSSPTASATTLAAWTGTTTITSTLTLSATPGESFTGTPEVSALGSGAATSQPEKSAPSKDGYQVCVGIILVLAGLLIAWSFSRTQRRAAHPHRFFRKE